ncbi:hypothetical protein Pcar_0799 [Syntrophotalea carbinolica DSM 2380]|uniref:Uncharacterized protein n=1 Tax=Syntrophotalea carbinolica (strain DSM 2380 / NBRC 103641 / GraBd1) TaxID=338963 RepID=Q3A6F1_SYNC1|nr:hypothetical protein [Syntrophotalea carbinolica]ABA88056.1 hypothetical protein Pcar_0799 [Syntrophotalea carbinolica DSM 2380]
MAKRLSPEDRRKIHESPKTYREIAEEFGISVASVARWKNREDFRGRGTIPKYSGRVSEFEKAVFRECIWVTRYPYKKLVEFLAPLWKELPSSDRLERLSYFRDIQKKKGTVSSGKAGGHRGRYVLEVGGKLFKPDVPYSPRTLYRILKESLGDDLKDVFDRETPEVGTLALHAVGIQWFEAAQDEGSAPIPVNGEVLCLFERHTGMAYLKVYRDRISAGSLASSVGRFLRMCSIEIRVVKLVNFYSEKGWGGEKSTVLQDTESGISEIILGRFDKAPKINFDPQKTPHRPDRIVLPGIYPDQKTLEVEIFKKTNLYNSVKRKVGKGKRWQDFTPRQRLWRVYPPDRRSRQDRLEFNQRVSIPIRDDSSGDDER